MVEISPGPALLHCRACRAITIGLGTQYQEQSGSVLPLPPVVSYHENEFTCQDCDVSLSIEVTLRSSLRACGPCSGEHYPSLPERLLRASALSVAEREFLGMHTK